MPVNSATDNICEDEQGHTPNDTRDHDPIKQVHVKNQRIFIRRSDEMTRP
jgi:hypothetical protein